MGVLADRGLYHPKDREGRVPASDCENSAYRRFSKCIAYVPSSIRGELKYEEVFLFRPGRICLLDTRGWVRSLPLCVIRDYRAHPTLDSQNAAHLFFRKRKIPHTFFGTIASYQIHPCLFSKFHSSKR